MLCPELFECKFVNVEVETHSALAIVMTVMDWWGVTDRQPNATVMHSINADAFYDLLYASLARL